MRFSRPVRLPLQIGASSAWNMARSGLAMLAVFALSLGDWLAFVVFGGVLGIVLGFMLLFYFAMSLGVGLFSWPSDLVMDDAGIHVEGGIEKPRSFAWNELRLDECRIEEKKETERGLFRTIARTVGLVVTSMLIIPIGMIALVIDKFRKVDNLPVPDLEETHTTVSTLVVVPHAGVPLSLGEAERPIERESFRAVLATLRAAGGVATAKAGESQAPEDPRLLTCAKCGAAVALEDAPTVPCRYCAASVEVPSELRERMRAVQDVSRGRKKAERLIGKLLEQPRARRAGRYLKITAWLTHLAWMAALTAMIWLWWEERLATYNKLHFLAAAAAVIVGAFLLARLALVDRYALRLLTVELAARPSETATGSYECRNCGAPFAAQSGHLLVRCVYCDEDNILGIDLRHEVRPVRKQVRTLRAAFRERSRQRLLWGGLALFAPLLFACAAFAGQKGFQYRSPLTAVSEACYRGRAVSCVEVARWYEKGEGVEEDRGKARDLADRACDLGYAEGCFQAARHHDFFTDDFDSEEGTERYKKACELHHGPACHRVGDRYQKGHGAPRDAATATSYYRRGCDAGDSYSCAMIEDTPR